MSVSIAAPREGRDASDIVESRKKIEEESRAMAPKTEGTAPRNLTTEKTKTHV
jgi:hypothetical protein